ncbi:unnamed protein product [Ascophyllum nodosum]
MFPSLTPNTFPKCTGSPDWSSYPTPACSASWNRLAENMNVLGSASGCTWQGKGEVRKGRKMVTPVFGSAGSAVTKGIDLDEMFSDFFMFGDEENVQDTTEGGIGIGGDLDVGLDAGVVGTDTGTGVAGGTTAGAGQPGSALTAITSTTSDKSMPGQPMPMSLMTTSMTAGRGRGSRGIGIGIGVAAGVASAHRGLKRELSESNKLGMSGNTGGRGHGHGHGQGNGGSVYGARGELGGRSASEQQKLERRQERNREHAKRSRIRKKFMLESLQEQLLAMRKQNMALRQVVKEHMPSEAAEVFEKCTNEKALFLSGKDSECAHPILSDEEEDSKEPNCLLLEPDFQLMQALMESQQNFTISDPSMPDNPIFDNNICFFLDPLDRYAWQGFLNLTGYTIQNVIGRNCRFLQGPGTDPRAIDVVRRGVGEGRDTSVCLLNYKADGTPFWNQFFVAALRDDTGKIVNYVGVQCEVQEEVQDTDFRERLRKIPLPEELMRDDNDDHHADDEIYS